MLGCMPGGLVCPVAVHTAIGELKSTRANCSYTRLSVQLLVVFLNLSENVTQNLLHHLPITAPA